MSGSEDRRSGARHGAGAGRNQDQNRGHDPKKPQHSRGGKPGPRDKQGPRDGKQGPRDGKQGGKPDFAGSGGGAGRPPKRDGKKGFDKPRGEHGPKGAQGPKGGRGPKSPAGTKAGSKNAPGSKPPQRQNRESQKQRTDKSRSAPARTEASKTTDSGPVEPTLPEEIDPAEVQDEVRRELRPLPKHVADNVAAHLLATGYLLDSDPQQALEHARYARKRASRIPSVREAAGVAAYNASEWNEALNELRTARRLSGGPGHVALMADAERAMGRPERAIELSRSPEAAELGRAEAIELRIVAAGARRDLGEIDASVVSLQIPELDPQRQDPWSARLFYAYADNLLAAGRVQESFTWFVHAAHADDEEDTDAPGRLDELVERLGGPEVANELVNQAIEGSGSDAGGAEDDGPEDHGTEDHGDGAGASGTNAGAERSDSPGAGGAAASEGESALAEDGSEE
ncbi:tetratricopeptide repeat protein [Salinifilum ghardaiensis]